MKHFFVLFTALIATTLWAADFEVDGIAYNFLGGDSVEVTYKSPIYSGSINIPSTITYNSSTFRVTRIGQSAFYYCTSLTSVTIPNSVTSIMGVAFYYCTSLSSINIPNSVTEFDEYIFSYCTSLPVENGIRYADGYLVEAVDKSLSTYTIKEGTRWIGTYAFSNCPSLSSLTIPNTVISFERTAFYRCSELCTINIPNSVTNIEELAFFECYSLTSVVIPDGITSIGEKTFCGCKSLTSVTLPNSVTCIGKYAFSECSALKSITIPDEVKTIDECAFSKCSSLSSITIGKNVTNLNYYTFYYCESEKNVVWNAKNCNRCYFYNVESFVFGDSVEVIPAAICSGFPKLTSITIPNSVTSIGCESFSGCTSLKSITIPNSVMTLGHSAFKGCTSLQSVSISKNVNSIESYTFENCSALQDITFSDSVRYFGNRAFYGCSSLQSIHIPDHVTSIGDEAFSGCSSLYSVSLPENVETLGRYVFSGCTSLPVENNLRYADWYLVDIVDKTQSSYIIKQNTKKIGEGVLTGCTNAKSVYWNAKDCPLSVGRNFEIESFGTQVESFVFGDSVEIIPASICSGMSKLTSMTIPNGVTRIGYEAFRGCTSLKSINIPNSVKTIGGAAFEGCTSLQSVTNLQNVNIIESYAFENCSVLQDITLSDSLPYIGAKTFYGCSSLQSIHIPDLATSIGDEAFSGCSILESAVVGSRVTKIGKSAFKDCTSLQTISLSDSLVSIGASAFENCSTLQSINIPQNVKSVGESAFLRCTSLKSANIPQGVTTIEKNLFCLCSSLESILIPQGVTSIGNYAFDYCSSLYSIIIPDNVTRIGNGAFYKCESLRNLTIGKSVSGIGEQAFIYCDNLDTIYNNSDLQIKANSKENGYVAYYARIVYEGIPCGVFIVHQDTLLTAYRGQGGDIVLPDSLTRIKDKVFYNDTNISSVTIPFTITNIGNSAFEGCSTIKSITVSNPQAMSHGISIGSRGFYGCTSLTSIDIPIITYIGSEAFMNCKSLLSVVGNICTDSLKSRTFYGCSSLINVSLDSVISFGQYAFASSGITSLTFGNHLIDIEPNAFYQCSKLTDVHFGDSIASIGYSAFSQCASLSSVRLPNYTLSVGNSAFEDCSNLSIVVIGDSSATQCLTIINDMAFSGCTRLSSLTLSNSIKSIGTNAFWNASSLESIVIPDSITEISSDAFSYIRNLKYITIGRNVTFIGSGAFSNCPRVKKVYFLSDTPPTLASGVWSGTIYSGTYSNDFDYYFSKFYFVVPCGKVDTYKSMSYTPSSYISSNIYYKRVIFTDVPNQLTLYSQSTMVSSQSSANIFGFTYLQEATCTNDTVIVSATSNFPKYVFDKWSDGNTDNPRTVVLTQDITLSAQAKIASYAITTTATNGSAYGSGTYTYGSQVELSAKPNVHYHFDHWSDGNTENPRMVTVTGTIIYEAIFALDQHMISTGSDNGQITGSGLYEYGSSATLEVTPNYGYYFTHWTDGNTDNPRVVQVTQDTYYQAMFAKNIYTYTISSDSLYGYVSSNGEGAFLSPITIEATPTYGYHFTEWSDGNVDNPYTFILSQDTLFHAFFAKNIYTIYAEPSNPSYGSVSGSGQKEYLDQATLTATPNYGYYFTQWSDGNTDNPRQCVLTQDITFEALFALIYSGSCGDDLTWNYSNGTLSIAGTGDMYDYTQDSVPWLLFRDGITNIVISNGATSVGQYAFYGCGDRDLKTVVLPNSIEVIGDYAFANCTYLKNLILGTNLVNIGNKAFDNDQKLLYVTCYAMEPPTLATDAFVNWDAYLSVPCEVVSDYKVSVGWKLFTKENVQCIGAEPATTNSVIVQPGDNTATIIWPTNAAADSYTIEITKDGMIFCTLTFNADGQLTNIAFAPGRGSNNDVSATAVAGGYRFTITGLDAGTKYTYRVDTQNAVGTTIQNFTGEFTTTGGATALNETSFPLGEDRGEASKFIRNGHLLIQTNNHTYTATGQEL